MIIQHETQHNETMLQTLQLMQGEGYRPEAPVEPPAGGVEYGEMVPVPGGPFVMGTGDRARALDNERDAPEVHVPGFLMDRTPVTNAPTWSLSKAEATGSASSGTRPAGSA
jgi:gamma-glutamyl hercynylcysteine S-oxide synthase